MAQKLPIDEQNLDDLLKELYLEENGQGPNQQDADFVMKQEYPASMNPAREQELISSLEKSAGGSSGSWVYVVAIVAIAVVSLLLFYLSGSSRSGNAPVADAQKPVPAVSSVPLPSGAATAPLQPDASENNREAVKAADTFDRPDASTNPGRPDAAASPLRKEQIPQLAKVEKRVPPVLAEKDRLKYQAIKQQMILGLIKFSKSLYTRIPAFKTVHAGEPVILDGFAIRNTGITNLEYKVFLADLLAQSRSEEYFKCEIRSSNWKKQGYPNLAENYFQDKTYNDFPVVNVSYDAARLFCKWLEEETRQYIRQNHLKLKDLQIRLPYDEEWVFAAREGYAKIAFEKGYNTIYDESAGLVNRSFTNRVELVKKHAERVDTLYGYYATNRYGWPEKEILDFFNTGLSYTNMVPVDTIYIDRMKTLGKFGHVSEMVPQKGSNKLWLSGLSWNSKEEYQKLEQEFRSNGSSPFVGFRLVVVNPNEPEYKNPFW